MLQLPCSSRAGQRLELCYHQESNDTAMTCFAVSFTSWLLGHVSSYTVSSNANIEKPWSYLCSLEEQSYFQGPPRTMWSKRPLCLQWCNAHTYSVCIVVEDHEVTIADIEAWQVVTGVLGIKDVFIYDISGSSCFRRVPSTKNIRHRKSLPDLLMVGDSGAFSCFLSPLLFPVLLLYTHDSGVFFLIKC